MAVLKGRLGELPFACAWPAIHPGQRLAVAYSGGADSTALLHLCAALWPGQVAAIHIHHGLQAAADDFAQHCQAACDALQVPLHSVHVQAKNAKGESPEDAARKARYATLAAVCKAHAIDFVALGQHADDQVETMLIALGRGAGVAGLAGMPATFERHGVRFERPLLAAGSAQIRQWLTAHNIGFIEDPTNADMAFQRNHIRHTLVPALQAVFPQFRETFARTARNMASALELNAQAAIKDIAITGLPPTIAALQQLPIANQANVLRHWLKTGHGVAGSEAQMAELLAQIADCTNKGKRIHIKLGNGFIVRNAHVLEYQSG